MWNEDITITLLKYGYPRDMIKCLLQEGYQVGNKGLINSICKAAESTAPEYDVEAIYKALQKEE